jgi:4-carboxymuconolactone decarboxylase
MAEPRVTALAPEAWHPDLARLRDQNSVDGKAPPNILRTLAHHPALLKRWAGLHQYVLVKSRVPARDRELLVLRTSQLCGANYIWERHQSWARDAGLTEAEIEGVLDGGFHWSDEDAAVLTAADELHSDYRITDVTWSKLAQRYDEQMLIDLLITAGEFHMTAMAVRSLGIQLEEGVRRSLDAVQLRPQA